MFSWLSSHGGHKGRNGSQVHVEKQDSLLEILPMLRIPLAYMRKLRERRRKARQWSRLWVGLQIVLLTLAACFTCHATMHEHYVQKELGTIKNELEEARKERAVFMKRIEAREQRP